MVGGNAREGPLDRWIIKPSQANCLAIGSAARGRARDGMGFSPSSPPRTGVSCSQFDRRMPRPSRTVVPA